MFTRGSGRYIPDLLSQKRNLDPENLDPDKVLFYDCINSQVPDRRDLNSKHSHQPSIHQSSDEKEAFRFPGSNH